MKKAVITILGTILPPREGQKKAKYYFSNDLEEKFDLKQDSYTNIFPLLIDNFQDYGDIKSIYTNLSKKNQTTVLNYERLEYNIEENGLFISENLNEEESDYSYFLDKYNELIEKYDSVIIDVSHGFRHFPILAVVNLIIQNIKNPEKIEYIFFAKEVEQYKKYEIIDLKEYLELANLSFMLSTFNDNYTVSNNIKFTNTLYQEIADELSAFSSHFLSNSLKILIDGTLISEIISNLKKLKEKKEIKNFQNYIDDIIKYLESIQSLKNENEWMKLYKLSKIMDKRGYQLNAITLLFESVGFYCADRLGDISVEIDSHIKYFQNNLIGKKEPLTRYSTYTLVNQSRNIVKLSNSTKPDDEFVGEYLYNPDRINLSKIQWKNLTKSERNAKKQKILAITAEIATYVDNCDDIGYFQDFIREIENLRNNLAHGNSSESIVDVKETYKRLKDDFKIFCIDMDILK